MKKLPLMAIAASIGFASNLWAASGEVNEETVYVAAGKEAEAWDINSKPGGPIPPSEIQNKVISKPRRPNPPQ